MCYYLNVHFQGQRVYQTPFRISDDEKNDERNLITLYFTLRRISGLTSGNYVVYNIRHATQSLGILSIKLHIDLNGLP